MKNGRQKRNKKRKRKKILNNQMEHDTLLSSGIRKKLHRMVSAATS